MIFHISFFGDKLMHKGTKKVAVEHKMDRNHNISTSVKFVRLENSSMLGTLFVLF